MVRSGGRSATGRRGLLPLLLVLVLGCGAGGDVENTPQEGSPQERGATVPTGPAPTAGSAWVIFGSDTVRAEVARTTEERARGLMYRDQLPAGTGMIFVFPEADIRSFWMANTYIALDIAFMDADFRVVDIQQMEPLSEEFTQSRAPALFVLEVPQGWFAEHGVEVGDQAQVVFGP